jgi:hypothetical protein
MLTQRPAGKCSKRTLIHRPYLSGIEKRGPPPGRVRGLGMSVETLGKCLSYRVPKSELRRVLPRSGAAFCCAQSEQQFRVATLRFSKI